MNGFGQKFRVSLFGESHGRAIGIVMDGVPAGIPLSEQDFSEDILRRKSGAKGTTPRIEDDRPEILSGVFGGKTTGAPLAVVFRNNNTKSSDYEIFKVMPRPGHADFAAGVKWDNFNDPRGGGHFSGRLTLPVVAAGVVAKKIIGDVCVNARLVEVGGVSGGEEQWRDVLDQAIKDGDSLGGIVECSIDGVPTGVGEPFFDSVESLVSHAVFSIPGVRGVEFGDGFHAARMKGSEHNDPIISDSGECGKNGAGGVNGGLANGNPIVFRVAFKPTSSIRRPQQTYDFSTGGMGTLEIPGRHDVCFALRTPVVVEAMAAIVMADLMSHGGFRGTMAGRGAADGISGCRRSCTTACRLSGSLPAGGFGPAVLSAECHVPV